MTKFVQGKLGVENITDLSPYKKMERGGRVCYRSDHLIKEGSANKFIRMIRDRKHYSVLGHSQLYASLAQEDALDIDLFCPQHLKHQFTFIEHEERVLVAAGFDTWLQFFEYVPVPFAVYFIREFPEVFGNLEITEPDDWNNEVHFELDAPVHMHMHQAMYAIKETFVLTVDRATAMQLRTYRFATHSVESQRYVNYVQRGFTYITPPEAVANDDAFTVWFEHKRKEMEAYAKLIDLGYKPEFARVVLGQDIQCQMVITASLWEWKHIFECRLNSYTQSNARTVVQMIKDNLLEKYNNTALADYLK